MEAYINCVSYYLPENVLDNNMISTEHPEWEAEKISNKTGIYKRHIAANNEFASDMAVKVSLKLFNEFNVDFKNIDFLIYCTQSPDYFLPTTACILQNKLGLSTNCGALDFNLGCSGYVYGLSLAKGLIVSKIATNVLFITSETYSKFINSKDKSNKTIFGDAATATLISSEKGLYRIGEFSLGTDGSGAENLIVKNGGIRNLKTTQNDVFDDNGNFLYNDSNLYMNGNSIFSFTSLSVPILVQNAIKKNKLSSTQIDYYLFHQANKYMLDFIRKKMKIDSEKFIYYLENVGNTVSNSIPIALIEECIKKDKRGKFLLAGFGVGYSFGSCVIESC